MRDTLRIVEKRGEGERHRLWKGGGVLQQHTAPRCGKHEMAKCKHTHAISSCGHKAHFNAVRQTIGLNKTIRKAFIQENK